ncbi:tol-pal system-associated acyl-CoA thioesterase [Tianweitania sp. BSSL-BM11]|uniref:Tol-pal system-associated acyl-CoA thioesterase n=1 Tax=Tianweitania aestuarii TaxID=2814886 RepID=A0ABS5RZT4_9HYPH|nr:tol-pal system-associated acyl-CoA thioesterase [Tianweitania aestuarii]MBS9722571.1 tol-pal system-associated acyl-CoA thioesterase [Tianweitania aestuarii]
MADHAESAAAADVNPSVGLAGTLFPGGHRLQARVYFADTDFSGVVYHGRYLEFFERGRSDYLRLAGVHHNQLAAGQHGEALIWVVTRMEIDWRSPARIDHILTIETRTQAISGARITMAQVIKRGETVLVQAKVQAAVLGPDGRPRRFPKEWIEAFQPDQPA